MITLCTSLDTRSAAIVATSSGTCRATVTTGPVIAATGAALALIPGAILVVSSRRRALVTPVPIADAVIARARVTPPTEPGLRGTPATPRAIAIVGRGAPPRVGRVAAPLVGRARTAT